MFINMVEINDIIIGFIFFGVSFLFYLKKWSFMDHSLIQNIDIKIFLLILIIITNLYIFVISKFIRKILL